MLLRATTCQTGDAHASSTDPQVTVTFTCDLWATTSNVFILESCCRSVLDVMRFPQGVPEISHWGDQEVGEVTMTLTLISMFEPNWMLWQKMTKTWQTDACSRCYWHHRGIKKNNTEISGRTFPYFSNTAHVATQCCVNHCALSCPVSDRRCQDSKSLSLLCK